MKYRLMLEPRENVKQPASSENIKPRWGVGESSMEDSKADSTQPDKFRQLARELECDEDEAAFEDKVRKVATAPKPEAPTD